MTRYASATDLDLPLASGVLANPGRTVDVDTTLDLFVLDMHGLAANRPVEFRAEGSAGALPGGITEGTTYYAIVLSQSRFQVSATSGGAAVDLTSAGENVIATFPVPVDAALDWASRVVDEHLPAHDVPFPEDAVPETVRLVTAQLAGAYLSLRGAVASAAMAEAMKVPMAMLDRWAKHAPVRGAERHADLAVGAGAGTSACAWRRFGGL